jgi:galactokinase
LDEVHSLSELQHILGYTAEDMIDVLKDNVEDKIYKLREIEDIIGQPLIKSTSTIPYSDAVLNNPARDYQPFKRAQHILQENLRLKQLKSVLDLESNDEDKIKTLVQLMNDSAKSCKLLYEASSDEVDILIEQLLKYQDVSCAKICGSGWGGSVLAIARRERVDIIISGIIKDYYNNKENNLIINDDLDMIIFPSAVSGGCCILDPQYEIWF